MALTTTIKDDITSVANKLGVNTALALAIADVETGGTFDPTIVGDNGTSFGLYQLHQGGELTAAGLTPQEAYNPITNATVALTEVAAIQREYPTLTNPGSIAALAQRPGDPTTYAANVNAAYAQIAGGNVGAGALAAATTSGLGASSTATLTVATNSSGTSLDPSVPGALHQLQDVMNMHGYDAGWLGVLNIPADFINIVYTVISRLAIVGIGVGCILIGLEMLNKDSGDIVGNLVHALPAPVPV